MQTPIQKIDRYGERWGWIGIEMEGHRDGERWREMEMERDRDGER